MALAIHFEDLICKGHVRDYVEIATLGHVTRARVTRMINLRLLASDLQEQLLNASRIEKGRDSLCLRKIQSISIEPS